MSGSRKVSIVFRADGGSLTPEWAIAKESRRWGRLVQICSLCDQELEVVKARNELVEGALGSPGVLHQADFEPRARLERQGSR